MKSQSKSETEVGAGPLRKLKADRSTLWIMIPVLMGIILLLNLSMPERPTLPTSADHARWLDRDLRPHISLAFDDPVPFMGWADDALADHAISTRRMGTLIWVRIDGPGDWTQQPWPGQPRAAAALGNLDLAGWDAVVNRIIGIDGASPRSHPQFAYQALAARFESAMARTPQAEPVRLFEGVQRTLKRELNGALDSTATALPLLERMALENLSPRWNTQLADAIQSITYNEFSTWQTP
ncbi:hypothetical protein GH975_01050 [Litorivicinus lipolyticus]|uniref:Uncharacterized protein n=1 Tax=Litorivicinus lipolyticus TaxID=418701 RepID=A0A5Q2QAD0_9GAMM|nr:hypothetical protein [Litorivicinus lipolyticus]QGG79221.1 hypothetical protein GH975_01050 [Litorivicinus lipolyticus]